MEECNLFAKPGLPLEIWIYISSSTVSSRLQRLITTTLHHWLATVQLQRLFRWLALKMGGGGGLTQVTQPISQCAEVST